MKDSGTTRRALGRGLDALLPTRPVSVPQATAQERSVFSCAIDKLVPQKGQPRQFFATARIDELAQSIREHGLIEPLVVRKAPGQEGKFEIIAGERRWRASQRAGLKEVLVVVKDVSPKNAFELAIIENIQREDLNAVELAEAFDRLIKEHGYTQDALAERVGKDRSTITNCLRLLKLPPRVRTLVTSGELSEGHARALLGAPPQQLADLADKVIRGKLSVRATEDLVRGKKDNSGPNKGGKGNKKKGAEGEKSASVRDLETRLARALGTRVFVRDVKGKGEVAIPYVDLDMLDRIIAKLMK